MHEEQGIPTAYDEAQLEELQAFERELRPELEPGQSLIRRVIEEKTRRRDNIFWVCPARALLHRGPLPPPSLTPPEPTPGTITEL